LNPAHFKWFFPQGCGPEDYVPSILSVVGGLIVVATLLVILVRYQKANLNVEWNKSLGVCIPIRRGFEIDIVTTEISPKDRFNYAQVAVETKSIKGEV